ncbi:MAG: class F sortase [Peptococcaceae bacterium]|jgi:sortase (surface protein transpeptidase)|nr:class F sortase [Peptococcaceae bacterium]
MKNRQSRVLIAVLAFIFILSSGWFIYQNYIYKLPVQEDLPTVEPVPTEATTTVPRPTEPTAFARADGEMPAPSRIVIPFLEIDAIVESVGVDSEGRMATSDTAENVAWYKYGPSPGFEGNALLDGHNSWGKRTAVFAKLPTLPLDESVVVYYEDGSWATFRVITNNSYPLDNVPSSVMSFEGPTRTTVITCTGTYRASLGTHDQRCVVTLRQIEYFLS